MNMNQQIDIDLEDLGPYQVRAQREIIALLRRLAERRELVRMIFADGTEAVATTVLAADEHGVIVDAVRDEAQMARIQQSGSISFDTRLDGIRIVFFASQPQACMHEEFPALCMPLPESVIRLQRREYYRVMTPRCTILVPQPGQDGPRRLSFPVQNLSAGGLALIDEPHLLDATAGVLYDTCEITLPGVQAIDAVLRVMNCQDIGFGHGRKARRVGCEFVDLGGARLALVQRYVSKVQRDENAKLTGLGWAGSLAQGD
jgi:c-di-GMP-binding flagellar brake protein YcgR